MMYASWDMEHNRHIFLSFWTIFCTFTPLKTKKKSKFWKSGKNARRYYHFTHAQHKWQSYDVWFLRYRAWRTELFVILEHFLHFYPTKSPKNQNFEKLLKKPGDIIILHKDAKNHDHMPHCSWDMMHDKCDYFLFWAIFCRFTPLMTPKIKI